MTPARPPGSPQKKPAAALAPRVDADFLAAAGPESSLPHHERREIAFAGRSNVGKSSLLNSLCARRGLVRTSKTPGATRTINLFSATFRGGLGLDAQAGAEMVLADLPGYGFADRSKGERAAWARMLEKYFKDRSELAGGVLLLDVRRGLEEDDRTFLEFARGLGLPVVVCATKLDKLGRAKQKPEIARLRKATGERVIGYSAVTHDGRRELWSALLAMNAEERGTEAAAEPVSG